MKTRQAKLRLNRQILDEASAWFVDFRAGDVDSAARERFDRWLRQSPEHIRAYMEIAKTYVELPALKSEQKIDVDALIARARAEGNVVPLSGAPAQSTPSSRSVSMRIRSWRVGLAAGLAVCTIAILALWLHRDTTYTTQIGERRSITLSDGSTIDLNARSAVRIHYSRVERDVELIDGQALFEVAKDAARPFVVRSGATRVRAVGTQFDVYKRSGSTVVTVVEGQVSVLLDVGPSPGPHGAADRVAPDTQASPATGSARTDEPALTGRAAPVVLVSAGEQVTVTPRAMAAPKRADLAAATAWTQHRLIFDASRLIDVIDDFNRYNARQLVIENAELNDLHVSGVYSSTDPASLIRFLKEQPGVQVVESDSVVRIRRP
jgi:transmembrane sensor